MITSQKSGVWGQAIWPARSINRLIIPAKTQVLSRFSQVWRHRRRDRWDRCAHRAEHRRRHQQPAGGASGDCQAFTTTGNTARRPNRQCNELLGRHHWEDVLFGTIRHRTDGWPGRIGRSALVTDQRQVTMIRCSRLKGKPAYLASIVRSSVILKPINNALLSTRM
jgi:hypothetical protein